MAPTYRNKHSSQWHGVETIKTRRIPIAEAKRLIEEHYRGATTQTTRDLLMILHSLADQQKEVLQRLIRVDRMVEAMLRETSDKYAEILRDL